MGRTGTSLAATLSGTMSKDAGLSEAESLLKIYGHTLAPGELDQKAALWEQRRSELLSAAYSVLGAPDSQELATKKRSSWMC
jgi:hypothetical protein